MAKDLMALVRSKKSALQAASGRKEKTIRPAPGKSRYRILPGWRGGDDPTFFHDFGQHFVKDAHGQLKAVYVCTEKTFGKPCAVCQAIEQGASVADTDEVINALKESRSKGKALLNVLHRDGESPNSPQILELTPTTFEKVLEVMEQYYEEGINILDLDEGVDLVISRTGKGLNTEYSVMAAVKSEAVNPSVLKELHNLDEYVKQEYDEGKLKALSAVGQVSGLLTVDTPRSSLPSASFDEDVPDSVVTREALDVAVGDDTPPARKEASLGGDELSDDDLNDLLADLGD